MGQPAPGCDPQVVELGVDAGAAGAGDGVELSDLAGAAVSGFAAGLVSDEADSDEDVSLLLLGA